MSFLYVNGCVSAVFTKDLFSSPDEMKNAFLILSDHIVPGQIPSCVLLVKQNTTSA